MLIPPTSSATSYNPRTRQSTVHVQIKEEFSEPPTLLYMNREK